MNEEARERFAQIASLPDEDIHLDEAALLIAAETRSQLDVGHYLTLLNNLADKFESTQAGNVPLGVSVNGLIEFIHISEGFSGNVRDYYDPDNSYLNRVLDTRNGIPITLALLHISLGARLDIAVKGIAFPGHFLVSYGSDQNVIVDPFSGRILSRPDCATLLKQLAGPRAVLQDEYFATAGNKDILIRILDNLKQIFWQKKAWDESKACIDRQLLLLPGRPEFNIQLGAVYEMQGNVSLAQHTYTQVLQHSDDDKLRQVVSQRLLALETRGTTLH
ncbi:MAG: transglutaminase-like domain-containing protein [Proteobacteria bacterium]|nr:transglutaminase-like domain-containing protein [Pseudomonadota bacterium]MDA1300097.1 transglutaminase-like domain-containing protein [Pseudomonadota bacterium]